MCGKSFKKLRVVFFVYVAKNLCAQLLFSTGYSNTLCVFSPRGQHHKAPLPLVDLCGLFVNTPSPLVVHMV